jgi:PKD repeat protein
LTGIAAIPPTADFAASPLSGEWPLVVSFTNLSTGTIGNSYWEFGDGATTNTSLLVLTHSYPALGSNTVRLTASGPLGTNTLTRSNYVIVTDVLPVALAILQSSNQVQLIWREGILQSAGGVTDVFTNVPAAVSPYTISPAEAALFFRVKVR